MKWSQADPGGAVEDVGECVDAGDAPVHHPAGIGEEEVEGELERNHHVQ